MVRNNRMSNRDVMHLLIQYAEEVSETLERFSSDYNQFIRDFF